MKIGILGAGSYGTALGGLIQANAHEVYYYDPAQGYSDLSLVTEKTDYIVLCIPASALAGLLSSLPKNRPIIIATKGFLTTKPFDEFDDYLILSGPSYADDIKSGKKSKLTITDMRIQDLLKASFLSFDFTFDRLGVLMCGALKNVYAILAGYLELRTGTSEWEKYIKDVSTEMRTILTVNGANQETFELACGIDDLKLTCDSPSRNYRYGQSLKTNVKSRPSETVEGIDTINRIIAGDIVVPATSTNLGRIIKIRKEGQC